MRRISLCYCLFVWMVIGGCQSKSKTDWTPSEKEILADRILHKVGFELKQKYDLRPIGTMGQMMYNIEILGLHFQYFKPLDIPEARKLLLFSLETLLGEINQEKQIYRFLCTVPLRPTNIEIAIFLARPDGRDVADGNLSIVKVRDGVLEYKINDPKTDRFAVIYRETYEEAVKRLADNSVPPLSLPREPQPKKEDPARVCKGISFVGKDGSIWQMDEKGRWNLDPRSVKPKK